MPWSIRSLCGSLFFSSARKLWQMDNDNLDPIDILSHITNELQTRYRGAKDATEQANVLEDFLKRWEADMALETLKKVKVEFSKDLDWFNVAHPLSIQELEGKLLVLDFFTYCCINCMHVLPELHALEQLFPIESGLVVIGVHSPKFANERDGANILSAAQRYGIEHPIVNDSQSKLWRNVGIRCWPSLLVLSPDGAPLLLLMGEGHGEFLQNFTKTALRFYNGKQQIKHNSLLLRKSTDSLPASNLRFPAKIARSESGNYAVADAGNHRILVFQIDGKVLYKIGDNEAGFVDGDFHVARFNCPQGLIFLNDDTLLVADTENHALRQIKLIEGRVETLSGTGIQGHDRVGGKVGVLQALSSPWDVAIFKTRDMDMSFHVDEQNVPEKTIVLIAMAGMHQIWGYFPEGIIGWKFRKYEPRTCVALVGNGLEENRNNSYPQNAAFAQPSGLAMANDALYIADSESSSIRRVSMVDGKVTAVVGGDRNPLNLFAFGDIDGKQYNAKLQHPLGLAYNFVDNKIYVADTYNHKVKCIDTNANSIETLNIKNESGELLVFNEPAGLCFDQTGEQLLVSDTNNHNIQLVNMKNLVAKRFVLSFAQVQNVTETDTPYRSSGTELTKNLPLHSFKYLKLHINFHLQDGLKFTPDAPQKWQLISNTSALVPTVNTASLGTNYVALIELQREAQHLPQQQREQETIKIEIALSLCDEKSCLMKRFLLILTDDHQMEMESSQLAVTDKINIQIGGRDINLC